MKAVPEFNHLAEYARFWGTTVDFLERKKYPKYTWELDLKILPDSADVKSLTSWFRGRIRWFLYSYALGIESCNGKERYLARHILSAWALQKLINIIWNQKATEVMRIYSNMAHFLTHDILHGLNGEPNRFDSFDTQLVFGWVEFFPVMSHSEIFLQWVQRDSNGDFVLFLQRYYISLLEPLAQEYDKNKDKDVLKLIDYFISIYIKCLLTIVPLSHEIVWRFGGLAQKKLYSNLPDIQIERATIEWILLSGLEKAWIKNNPTLIKNSDFPRKNTGAARAWFELIDSYFPEWCNTAQVSYAMKMIVENLIMWWCIRMVPWMPRDSELLQKQFREFFVLSPAYK